MKYLDRINQYQQPLLLILPVLYLIAGLHFRFLLGNLSLRSVDPDYVYFISGLSISEGAFKIGFIEHPGTPLSLLIALIFRIVYLFRGNNTSYIDDVFLHPDLYLSVASAVIIAISAGFLYYAGRKVYKTTQSAFYALLIQTAPFMPVIWYDLIGRITPELMMPFPIMLLTVLVISIYYEGQPVSNKRVFFLALISAFGLSIKLTYILLWIIPLFVIDTWKKRLSFTGISVFFFFVFAFPVTLQFNRFWGWIKNIFLYSGQYGGGSANIIDLAAMQAGISELFHYEKQFFYILICLSLVLTVYLVYYRIKTDKRLLLISAAVIITVVLQIIIVGKHYAHRNFIPALLLSPLMLFLMAEIIKKIWVHKISLFIAYAGVAAFLYWNIENHRYWLPIKTYAMGSDIEQRMLTWHVASQIEKDRYLIITSQNYGAPFIEYTLTYSIVWANHRKRAEYATILDKLYPHTYNYFTWDNTLKYWKEKFDAQAIIDSGKEVYLYIERDEEALYDMTITKLYEESEATFAAERELIYRNPYTSEVIYRLTLSPSRVLEESFSVPI